jgi:hydroxyacid-oxoacid transhydrogenase
LYDFINAPIGKGLAISQPLRPLIAGKCNVCLVFYELTLGHQVPTTAGTGSETTGTAILDITSKSFKTGIASRALKPTLGIVDTFNTETCPTAVHISAGLDVLFHSLESFTAIPFVLMSLLLPGFNSLAVDTQNAHQDPRIPYSDLRTRAAIL